MVSGTQSARSHGAKWTNRRKENGWRAINVWIPPDVLAEVELFASKEMLPPSVACLELIKKGLNAKNARIGAEELK